MIFEECTCRRCRERSMARSKARSMAWSMGMPDPPDYSSAPDTECLRNKPREVCSRCGNKGEQATAGCPDCHRSGPDSDAGMITMRRTVGGGTALTRMLGAAALLSMSAPPSRPAFDDGYYPRGTGTVWTSPPKTKHRASPEKKKKRKAADKARRKQR